MWLAIENPEAMGSLAVLILPAQVVLLLEISFFTTFAFSVTARFEMGFKETLKSCFIMANRHILTSFTCTAVFVALLVAIPLWPPIAFLAPGIYAISASYMLMRVFKKYRPEMDKDPRLELQEIEQQRAEEKRRKELSLPESPQHHIMEENPEEENENGT
jgi:hypothetical protein